MISPPFSTSKETREIFFKCSVCASGQDLHQKMLSLYVDTELAEDYFRRCLDSHSSNWAETKGLNCLSGPSYSKLTMSLVNVSLKFQMLISEMWQYFLLKKCKLLQCKSSSHVFKKNYQCIWL